MLYLITLVYACINVIQRSKCNIYFLFFCIRILSIVYKVYIKLMSNRLVVRGYLIIYRNDHPRTVGWIYGYKNLEVLA